VPCRARNPADIRLDTNCRIESIDIPE